MNDDFPAGFNKRDAIIYALGIGCTEMKYVYEGNDDFAPFPTIALALTLKGDSLDTQSFPPPFFTMASVPVSGPVLDGERLLELRRPLRSSEALTMQSAEKAIVRTGSGTVVQSETVMRDDQGIEVAKLTNNTFYVGTTDVEPRGTPLRFTRPVPATRAPDFVVEQGTNPMQASLYRLSGDYNPLHIDPGFASQFGYDQPILHGLCTLGFATRIVVNTCWKGDSSKVNKIGCRFTKPAYPGRVLVVEMWTCENNSVSFRVKDKVTGTTVIDQAFVEFNIGPISKL